MQKIILSLTCLFLIQGCGAGEVEVGRQTRALGSQCGGTKGVCSCGDTVVQSHVLTASDPVTTQDCSSDGLTIGASGIMLDCAGREIRAKPIYPGLGEKEYTNSWTGITIPDAVNSSTVVGCKITGFHRGVYVGSNSGNTVAWNTFKVGLSMGGDSNAISINYNNKAYNSNTKIHFNFFQHLCDWKQYDVVSGTLKTYCYKSRGLLAQTTKNLSVIGNTWGNIACEDGFTVNPPSDNLEILFNMFHVTNNYLQYHPYYHCPTGPGGTGIDFTSWTPAGWPTYGAAHKFTAFEHNVFNLLWRDNGEENHNLAIRTYNKACVQPPIPAEYNHYVHLMAVDIPNNKLYTVIEDKAWVPFMAEVKYLPRLCLFGSPGCS
jgi:hypothetical protein